MNLVRIALAALAVFTALVASACGGSGEVPDDAVAVVDGTEIPKADLDELMTIAKTTYEAREQQFPKAGTPEYQGVQTQYVALLVQREQLQQEADRMGVEITKKDVDDAIAELVKSRFDGKRRELDKALEQQGFSKETFRKTMESTVLYNKVFEEVTKDIGVSEEDILLYYTQNQQLYRTPESRDVRHILVAEKDSDDKVDYPKSKAEADRIYAQLRGGGDFAALAKQHSDDPSSKDDGGKITISRGQTVEPFDKVAFQLKKGQLSRPVRTEYGFHVIEALTPVRKAQTTKLEDVRAGIRQQLLQERRSETMTKWLDDLRKRYDGKVRYAVGYEPPDVSDTTTETE